MTAIRSRIQTPRNLNDALHALGRWALWAFLLVLLVRGFFQMLHVTQPVTVTRGPVKHAAAAPTLETGVFAERFVRAYLTRTTDPAADDQAIAGFLADDVDIAPTPGDKAKPVTVQDTSVARTAPAGTDRVRVTVAASTTSGTTYMSVPIIRDGTSLAVTGAPAIVAPPVVAHVTLRDREPVPPSVRELVEPSVTQFLRAYLSGDAAALEFVTAPGVQIRPVSGYVLDDLAGIYGDGPVTASHREVIAATRAKARDGTVFLFDYQMSLVFTGGRWQVEQIQ